MRKEGIVKYFLLFFVIFFSCTDINNKIKIKSLLEESTEEFILENAKYPLTFELLEIDMVKIIYMENVSAIDTTYELIVEYNLMNNDKKIDWNKHVFSFNNNLHCNQIMSLPVNGVNSTITHDWLKKYGSQSINMKKDNKTGNE